jgi:hypothetical protein
MTSPTLESFTAQSLDEGFDEIIVREWDATINPLFRSRLHTREVRFNC